VLPFANLSGDAQQEYFSDGISDDLISDLSRVPKLFVIARTSSFSYKGKAEKVQTIGRDLGVKYLLEGSARRAGDRVRINVQLVDAVTGNEVWSQRYDRQMHDIFKLQDEIVQSLSTTVGLELSWLERGVVIPQRTNNLEAYDYFLRGFEGVVSPAPDASLRSGKMFENAISLDPGYADAYACLALLHFEAYVWQWDDAHALDEAEELARKSVSLDDSNSGAYAVLGLVAAYRRRFNQAIADAERAITLDPNSVIGFDTLSEVSGLAGVSEQGGTSPRALQLYKAQIAYAKKAMRLDPRHPENHMHNFCWAYLFMGDYRPAAAACSAAQPNNPFTHVGLLYAYTRLGREQDAKAEAAQILRLAPNFSLEVVTKRMPGDWTTPHAQQFLEDLRKAGLK
jgi:TolB-like protein